MILVARALFKKKQFEAGPWIAKVWIENFPPVLLPVIYLKKNKNTYSTLREKNLQFILHISVKDNDLKKQKQTNISWVHYPKEIIYNRDDNYSNN